MLPARICWRCGTDFTYAPPRAETRHGVLICDCRGCGAVYPAAGRRRGNLVGLAAFTLAWKLAAVGVVASLIAATTKLHDNDLAAFGLGGRAMIDGSALAFPVSNASAYVRGVMREPSFGLVPPVIRIIGVLLLVLTCLMLRAPYVRSIVGVCVIAFVISTAVSGLGSEDVLGRQTLHWASERAGFAVALAITGVLAAPGALLVRMGRAVRRAAASERMKKRVRKARARRRNA